MFIRITFLFFILFIAACNLATTSEIIEEHPDGTPKIKKTQIGGTEESPLYLYQEFYLGGKNKIEGKMNNNKRTGKWNAYFENGDIWSYGEYSEGQREGRSIVYNPNGTMVLSGYYKNNIVDSIWITYQPNGDTAQVTMYKNGEIVSSYFNENKLPVKK